MNAYKGAANKNLMNSRKYHPYVIYTYVAFLLTIILTLAHRR